ncbi:MFS transporter [Flammeovirga kamogawensis]|uniref:MFS transporter n=1 Tax=Flammeovirga kamogawensis TaxID=373891 RepID=A0ABX8H448_9BACT|nr:MFS transporter [Flammeovirga kamogawensis]MBB6461765.1 EmrB/QacA subfamily drug resistance transporter [Flammeovirga kamogawensis]QWG10681.1 MFS transporter [Flammeovirga kamogawensis]TRX63784.1 MFS transporter [Flammeovirga kamogawensis]
MSSSKNNYSSTQKWTLLATILASSLVFIDGTALNVALPALQRDLNLSGAQLLWVINGYALFLSALLLLGGALGDLYGRNKIFLIGLVLFSVSSLFCGIAQTPYHLLIARSFQGIGGALLTPGSLSILSAHFDNSNRGQAIGLWSTFSALTGVLGPILGGWLAGMGLWRIIFFLNIPLSIVVLIVMLTKVPETRNTKAQKLDGWGALFVVLGLSGLTYGFIESASLGFLHPIILSSVFIGCASLVIFIFIEQKSNHPMMPLSLFKSSTFSGGNLLTLFVYAPMGGVLFFVPLNLIDIQGYSEVKTGLAMLPIIICIATISPLMGKYVDKNGYRKPLIAGPIIISIGYYLFSLCGITNGEQEYWTTFFLPFLILGIGMGITVAPLTTSVMGSVSEENIGVGSGINNVIARAANVLAVALMGALALYLFTNSVTEAVNMLELTKNVKHEILLEAVNFTGAKVPSDILIDQKETIEQVYKDAFVTAFNQVVYIAVTLTLLSSVVSYRMIK